MYKTDHEWPHAILQQFLQQRHRDNYTILFERSHIPQTGTRSVVTDETGIDGQRGVRERSEYSLSIVESWWWS